MEIDNRECAQSGADCFSQTEQAASFIAAEHLRAELPYPLVSVTSKYHQPHWAETRAYAKTAAILGALC